jgi:hypothetical protein
VIVMLAGPIKAWWGPPREGTHEHQHYLEWRTTVDAHLTRAGHLTYRPHEAFKGPWDERGQVVNDAILVAADVVLDLTPLGVPSEGTDAERAVAARHGKRVEPAPPPPLGGDLHEAAYAVVDLLGVDEDGQRQMGQTYAEWRATRS